MRILSLQISNVLSFKHHDDVGGAEAIEFDEGLNIIIGENGSGKSTALEVINFLFKRVLYKQYNVNQDLYTQRATLTLGDRKNILQPANNGSYSGFRLEPNWETDDKPQVIRIALRLDDIDQRNISRLKEYLPRLSASTWSYTNRPASGLAETRDVYVIDVTLNKNNEQSGVTFKEGGQDLGFEYLSDYNFFKEMIALYNLEHAAAPLEPLYESFTLISSYRNYHAFQKSVSLKDHHPAQQIQQIKNMGFVKSMNTSDQNEPTIFGLVRLKVAEAHFGLISGKLSEEECEAQANQLPFIVAINKRLEMVGLECKIKLLDLRTWQYSFQFYDRRRKRTLDDINSLSAGQKAIIHLVFEAFGRGDLKGGVVIIDEPEIHLHYQFQNEYLQVIRELNKTQGCQYILVTHSEALINSSTIKQVRRFSLSKDGYTEIRAPQLSTDQRMLIKILDNTRSTYAFFARKVLLVEGDSDRYFYKAVIQEQHPELDQEIAVLDIQGKGNFAEWSNLFQSFGLTIYRLGDLDVAIDKFYPNEKGVPLRSPAEVAAFKLRNPDWEARIESEYPQGSYILKNGDLEHYLGTSKGLDHIIEFCRSQLPTYLANDASAESMEIRGILNRVCA